MKKRTKLDIIVSGRFELETKYFRKRHVLETEYGMRKASVAAFVLLMASLLVGCGSSKEAQTTTLAVNKNFEIKNTIIEPFEEDYYDIEELKSMTLKEVADFNKQAVDDGISVEKLENNEGVATVILNYASPADYAVFNEKDFFAGTVEEAYDAGYDLDLSLYNVKDDLDMIGKDKLLEMNSSKIVISEEALHIITPGKITYKSSNVNVIGAKEVETVPEEGELSYILYK